MYGRGTPLRGRVIDLSVSMADKIARSRARLGSAGSTATNRERMRK
jgi:hypothetical protein